MTRYAQSLQRVFGLPAGRPGGDRGPRRRRVEARLPPKVADALGPDLERALADLLVARSEQLGLARPPAVVVTVANSATASAADGATVTVAIDGRPLAVDVVASGTGAGGRAAEVEAVVDLVDRALRRRLSLLLADADGDELRPVLAYLLDHGISLAGAGEAPEVTSRRPLPSAGDSAAERGELLLERLAPAELEFEVGSRTLRRVDSGQHDALVRAREEFFGRRGVQYPDLRLVPATGDTATVRLNHVRLRARQLPPEAGWPEAVAALQGSIDEHAHWFVRMSDVVTALGRLSYLGPELVAMVTDRYPMTTLTGCLRELVRDGESIRNLPRILWLLLEMGGVGAGRDRVRLSEAPLLTPGSGLDIEHDPVILASGVRKAVAEDVWRIGRGAGRAVGGRLPGGIETALTDTSDPAAVVDAEWRALAAYRAAGRPGTVVTRSTAALRAVRDVLQALPRPPKVIASQELPPDVALHR